MDIRIVKPGLLTSVQDAGRQGYQKYGVAVGGAMDAFALRAANLLVGNPDGEAALEITLLGPTVEFSCDSLVSLCGGSFAAHIGEAPFPLWRPVLVRAGSRLAIGRATAGSRAYLAVAGGLDVPLAMGSRSTDLRAGFGGWHGRALQAGDRLPVGEPSPLARRLLQRCAASAGDAAFRAAPWCASPRLMPRYGTAELRAVRGPEAGRFRADSVRRFFAEAYEVSPQSDRMGFRLAGAAPLALTGAGGDMISAAVCAGAVQVPPDGQPILLMADAQTTGGYPRIAHVAGVDLPVAAQLKPGSRVHFREISLREAQALWIRREQELKELELAVRLKAGWT